METPAEADAIIVARWLGTVAAMGWRPPGRGGLGKFPEFGASFGMLEALTPLLVGSSGGGGGGTGSFAKLVLFNTIDGQMLPAALLTPLRNATWVSAAPTHARNAALGNAHVGTHCG